MWTTPAATEMRFGFEVTMLRNEQVMVIVTDCY
jgi:coenzyme PQQ precursor peptide PqqA